MHQRRRHQEVDDGRQQQVEEVLEREYAFLPDHQCGDVAERAKRSARVGAHDNIDTGQGHKLGAVPAHSHHHGTHDQCRGQVVRDRRQTKRQGTCDPEQAPVTKALAQQPYPQLVEDTPFQHGVDIGHRHQQEEEQLSVLQEVVPYGVFDFAIGAGGAIGQGHEYPD